MFSFFKMLFKFFGVKEFCIIKYRGKYLGFKYIYIFGFLKLVYVKNIIFNIDLMGNL